DGCLLSEYGVVVPAARGLRSIERIQGQARLYDVRASASTGLRCFCRGDCVMKPELIDRIANSVLYEGYMLYPYRRSALKNRHRWNFGLVQPEGAGASQMTTECLAQGDDPFLTV